MTSILVVSQTHLTWGKSVLPSSWHASMNNTEVRQAAVALKGQDYTCAISAACMLSDLLRISVVVTFRRRRIMIRTRRAEIYTCRNYYQHFIETVSIFRDRVWYIVRINMASVELRRSLSTGAMTTHPHWCGANQPVASRHR